MFSNVLTRKQNLLIIGPEKESDPMACKISEHFNGKYEINIHNSTSDSNAFKQLVQSCDIICLTSSVKKNTLQEIMTLCQETNKTLYLIPGLFEILLQKANFYYIDDIPLFKINSLGLSTRQQWTKRIFDLFIAIPGLLLALFLFPLIALAIKLTSSGPVIYTQKRIGLYGKTFNLYKFRSMVHQAELHTGPVLTVKNDARVTKIGKFLRATRLDELPQLYNVLKGDMSIVGPRPERPNFVNVFSQTIPNYPYRQHTKPGITGLAQVKGKYSTSAEDKLRYDLWYICHYSLWLDIKIILQTIPVVLTGKSAAGISFNKSN